MLSVSYLGNYVYLQELHHENIVQLLDCIVSIFNHFAKFFEKYPMLIFLILFV